MFTEKAIILRKVKYGESDLILSFLNSRGQVFSAIAKSALKSKKRFGGGVLEPTHYVQLHFLKPTLSFESEKLSVLQEARLIYDFPLMKLDYDRLQLGLHIMKVVSIVIREGDLESKELFDLVGNSLKAIETSHNLPALRVHFEVKFLAQQGVLPEGEHYQELAQLQLKDHEKISLESGRWPSLQQHLQEAFASYIH